jgi:transcriptional regulator with XRE-family HTH domain
MSSIQTMSREEVLLTISQLVELSERESNLDYIFGSNGQSGKCATGNFSLLARGIEIKSPPGLSRIHISKVLRGKVQPSHDTLRAISQVTGLSIDRISEYIVEKRKS